MGIIEIFDLGVCDFRKAWRFQKEIFDQVKSGLLYSALILCRHLPVITAGRNFDVKDILVSKEELLNRKIEVIGIERGGKAAYHGPGQLTVYPIFNLNFFKKDLNWFLRELEQIAVETLNDFGIKAETHNGLTGVWLGNKKIGFIGIAVKNWVTYHGLSMNIKSSDLEGFTLIRPCGMDIEVDCMENILKKEVAIEEVKRVIGNKFESHFLRTSLTAA